MRTERIVGVRWSVLWTLLLAALASCGGGSRVEPQWQNLEVKAPSDRILWKVANMALNNRGYPRGTLDLAQMEVETGWRNDLAPFRGEGYRTKAHVAMEPLDRGVWTVDVRVQKAINMELERPLSLAHAEWKEVPDDVFAARVILQHIRSLLPDDIELRDPVDPIDELIERANDLAEQDSEEEEG